MFMKHGVFFCLAFGLILLPNHGADPGGKYHLSDLSKDMSSLARITEAINLGEYLTDKNANLELIAGELLNLGPNVTMSELESAGVVGLDTDLEAICSAVEKECGGAAGCVDDKVISEGIAVFNGINVTMFDEAAKALKDEKFGQMVKLNEHFESVKSGKQFLNQLNMLIGRLQNYTDSTFTPDHGLWGFTIESVLKSADGVNLIVQSVETNAFPKIVDSISAILVLENATGSFPSQQPTLNSFKKEFQSINTKSLALSAFLTAQSVDKFVKKANILNGLASRNGRSIDKLLTQGFPNGLADIDLLPKDVASSSFLKSVGFAGQNVDELKSLISPVTDFRKKLTGVQNSWDAIKFPNDTSRSIVSLQNLLRDASAEVTGSVQKAVSDLDPFFKCVEKVNLETTFQFSSFTAALVDMNILDQNIKDFLADFKTKIPNPLIENLNKVKALMNDDGVLTKLRNSAELKAAAGMLDDFSKLIEDVEKKDLSRTVNNLYRLDLASFAKWMADLGVKGALDCVAQKGGSPKPLKLKQDALLKLKASDPDISAIRTIAKSVQGPINEWKKTMAATKPKRAATGKPKNLKNIRKIAKSLANGAEKIRVLSEAYSIRADIQSFMKASQSIDKDIQGITDKKKQADALSVWTDKLKTWLTGLPASLETLDASLPKTRRKITDFGSIWNATEKFELLEVDAEKLRKVFKSINNPPGSAPVLQFVGYRGSLRSSILYPLQELESLFAFYFNMETVTTAAVITSTLVAETGMSLLTQIGIGVGVFIICGLIVLAFVCVFCRKRKNVKKAKTHKNKGDSSRTAETGTANNSVSLESKVNSDEKKPEDLLTNTTKTEVVRITLKNGQQVVGVRQVADSEESTKKLSKTERRALKKKAKTDERNRKRKEKRKKGVPNSNESNLAVDGILVGVKPEDVKKVEKLKPKTADEKAVAKLMARKDKTDEQSANCRGEVVLAQDCDHADPNQIMFLRRGVTKNCDRKVADKLSFEGVLFEIRSYPINKAVWIKEKFIEFFAFGHCSTEIKDETLVTQSERDPSAKTFTARDVTLEEKGPEKTQGSTRASAGDDYDYKQAPDWVTSRHKGGMSDEEWDRARAEEDRVDAEYQRTVSPGRGFRWAWPSWRRFRKFWKKNRRTDDPEDLNSRAAASGDNEVAASPSNEKLLTATSETGLIKDKKPNYHKLRKERKKIFKEDMPQLPKTATDDESFKFCQKWFEKCSDDNGNFDVCQFLAVANTHWFRSQVSFRNDKRGHPVSEKLIFIMAEMAIANLKKKSAYIEVGADATVTADIHGVYKDLHRIVFGRGHIYKHPRDLVLLGDYVDRGERGLCCVLLMMALIIHAPNNYHFLRGNHELESLNRSYGFRRELKEIFGAEKGERIRCKIQEVFNNLPIAANIKGKGFACHGMPCVELFTHEQGMNLIKKFPQTEIEWTVQRSLLWADPVNLYQPGDHTKPYSQPTTRKTPGVMDIGPVIVHAFLKKFGFQFVVRGHQMYGTGFADEFGDGTCYTLYSATNQRDINKPNYRNNNYAATMEIRDDSYWFDRYMDYGTFDPEGENLDDVTIYGTEEDEEYDAAAPGDKSPDVPNIANADKAGTPNTGTAAPENKKTDVKHVNAPVAQKKAPDEKQKPPIPKLAPPPSRKPSSAPPKK